MLVGIISLGSFAWERLLEIFLENVSRHLPLANCRLDTSAQERSFAKLRLGTFAPKRPRLRKSHRIVCFGTFTCELSLKTSALGLVLRNAWDIPLGNFRLETLVPGSQAWGNQGK